MSTRSSATPWPRGSRYRPPSRSRWPRWRTCCARTTGSSASPTAAQVPVEQPRVDDDAINRLADQLDQARTETRQVRERLREQVTELKAENVTLRRKLNEARQRISGLQSDLELRTTEANTADERVDAARAEVERELRKLRARITELEAVEHAARRTAGQERELASTQDPPAAGHVASKQREDSVANWLCRPGESSARRTPSPASSPRRHRSAVRRRTTTRRCSTSCWRCRRCI